ncbi:hypothetical protein [Gellertiella hungarica]|uniref:Uncharacterized protein n=1 Tax=Gellertiella hungarica TaxID=1572859 RepID=A0A7W6J889_9HYPH|nr:hypothetical protein [Gellertiella hungarica]MBB4066552.1 hypothetical protein [Gellertiella hungarica]
MIADLILWTVLVPLALGLALGLFSRHAGERRALGGGLLFVLALLAVVAIEGMPVFPPVAGKQKLPFVLAGLAVLFFLLGHVRRPAGRLPAAATVLLAAAVPAVWIGYRILSAAPVKAFLVFGLLFFFALAAALLSPSPRSRAQGQAPLAALLFALIATAVVSVTGGYIGMAQVCGAAAAATGGWLLLSYVAYLGGDDAAMHPGPQPLLAWLVLTALLMAVTALLAPSANPVALVLAALPLALAAWLERRGPDLPRALQPVAAGAICAVPALAAILVSVLA